MTSGSRPPFHPDADIHHLLASPHAENVRLAITLAQNPALRLQNLSPLVAVAIFHADLELRELAIDALAAQGLPQFRDVVRTHWQVTHPAGNPAVLYAALQRIEAELDLPAGALQSHLAVNLQVWPSGVAHRFPAAFLAWCRSQLDGDALTLPESLPVLPKALLQLEGLRHLTLTGRRLQRLPDWLGELNSLASFSLQRSAIQEFPPSLSRWTNLEALNLHCPRLRRFPTMLADNPQLQSLMVTAVSNAGIKGLEAFTHVEDLVLQDAQALTHLPAEMGRMQGLRQLSITRTALRSLPASMGQLHALRSLLLVNSPLQGVPAWLSDLEQLERVILDVDRLLPPSSLSRLRKLQGLEVVCPHATEWPSTWCDLPALRHLTVRASLSSLPPSFAQLHALRQLDLNHNPLQHFPAPLTQLPNLEKLGLTHTGITELPTTLRNWPALTHLELAHNGMTHVPPVLYNMPHLRFLDLRNNHLPLPEVMALRTALPATTIRTA